MNLPSRRTIPLFLLALSPAIAWGSLPVNHKSEGCVINGAVYSFYQGKTVYNFNLPKGFNLTPYEGKKVLLEGELSPGDFFTPKDKTFKTLGPCDTASKKLIGK